MAIGSISGQRVDLSNVSGVLPVENGGTGQNSLVNFGDAISVAKILYAGNYSGGPVSQHALSAPNLPGHSIYFGIIQCAQNESGNCYLTLNSPSGPKIYQSSITTNSFLQHGGFFAGGVGLITGAGISYFASLFTNRTSTQKSILGDFVSSFTIGNEIYLDQNYTGTTRITIYGIK